MQPAEGVFNVAFPVQYCFLVAKDHAGLFVVDVLDNGCDFRVGGAQLLNEVAAAGEICCAEDEHYHDLVCGVAAADEDVAQKPFAGVFVVGGEVEFGGKFADGGKDFVGGFVLDGAVGDGYDLVRVFLVNAKF